MGSAGKTYEEVTSEVRWGKETTAIWTLKGWREGEEVEDVHILLHNCFVNVGEEHGSRGRLRFYFEEKTVSRSETVYGPPYSHTSISTDYLTLSVDKICEEMGHSVHYEIQVDLVGEKLEVVTHKNVSAGIKSVFRPEARGFTQKWVVKDDFIKVKETVTSSGTKASTKTQFPPPAQLRLKISVRPVYIHEVEGENGQNRRVAVGQGQTKRGDSSLCQALKGLLVAEQNFADLKLETKDGISLRAHKIILAARSSVLRILIETEGKKEGFNGTIKLAEVNAKPMGVLLHWMYTEELHENAVKCLEEVVEVAIKFQLVDLIRILDRKVISICNEVNMFQLHQMAKKNGMLRAEADIARYIRGHV